MYQLEITHEHDLAFTAEIGREKLLIDAKGNGVTPLHALLAGVGSCVGVYIRKYCAGAKLNLENFKIKVYADLSPQPPASFRLIKVDINLAGCLLDERRQKAILDFIKNCPVHNTLKGNPDIEFRILC